MYKRRTKSGGLGIVRTVSKPQQSSTDQAENLPALITKPESSISNSRKSRATKPDINLEDSVRKRQTKTPEPEDPDEVLSDSEPSPKRSRRFFNSSTSVLRERTLLSNISAKSPASKITTKENSVSNSHLDIPLSVIPEKTVSKNIETINTSKPSQSKNLSNANNVTKNKEPEEYNSSSNTKSQIRVAHEKLKEDFKKNHKLTYLEEVLEKTGFLLSDGTSSNVLRTDQAVFIRDIRKAICDVEDETKRNVEHIMKDLEEYCADNKCFKYAISYTETAEGCDVCRGATQDSLMRLLLHVDCLQAPVTELLLLDKLAKFVMDDSSITGDTPLIAWVRMILQCFRFLEKMTNGKAVNDQLLEIVLVSADITIQQEVILSLPDIIQDTEHHHTALELSKLVRKSSPQLMTSALEALTNLSLQPEVRAEIQPQLLRAINKIPPDCLPTMLKFLFTDGDADAMDEVITYLRKELELGEGGGESASVQVLVFMTLRDALLVSRTLPGVWLKNITSVKTQVEHRPIDIVMLLVLLSISSDQTRHRAIEAVFRNKIRAELFTETLINETLKSYIPVIKEYFQVTIKLAGALLKSVEPAVVEFASKIYIGMFVNMEGLWCKWVLSDLQQGVCTGDTGMSRAALSVIQHLTDNHHHKVKPLGVILMLLLNKVSELALNEVCQLMDILCHIAYSEDEGSSDNCSILQDEINILVQKQLASAQLSTKRNGIIGCVMTIKHVTIVPENMTESCGSEKDETTDKTKKAIQLLEILLSSTMDSVEAQGLALDQLSHLLISGKTLDPTFVSKLSSLMRDKLQDYYLISASDFVSKEDVVKTALQFYLDDDPEGSIALNLAELVICESNSAKTKQTVGVSCLHPLLRLLRGLEMSDLSEIDALLGCHICMPVPQVYAEFGQLDAFQQHVALHCLFHCVNWLIEVVNCFAYLVKKNEAEKVVMRVRLIVWLRGLLSRCLPLAIQYTPPLCYFQALPKSKPNSVQDKPAKKKTKKKGKRKGKMKQDEDQPLTGTVAETSQVSEEEEEDVVEERIADLSKYKHFFRELDIDVWLVLTQPLTLAPAPEKGGQFSAELGPSELLYLLDDYVTKLSHPLTSCSQGGQFSAELGPSELLYLLDDYVTKLSHPLTSCSQGGQFSAKLGPSELLYLLDDYVTKLSHSLTSCSQGGQFSAELGPSELLYLLDDYVTKLSHSLTSCSQGGQFSAELGPSELLYLLDDNVTKLSHPLTSCSQGSQFLAELGPSELLYLLDDYVTKLSHSLTSCSQGDQFSAELGLSELLYLLDDYVTKLSHSLTSCSQGGQFSAELGPSELLYLLDDYVTKLSHSLTSSHKRISFLKTASGQNVVGFENLDKFTPLHIAKNTIKLLSFLCGFLEKTVEYTQNLVKVNDGILDSTGMFMEGSAEIKLCQGRLLKILTILFSWVGFQNPANSNYLLAALQKVASRVSGEQAKGKSRPQLVKDCVLYLTQCHEHVLDLTSACTLVDTIKALLHHAEHDKSIRTHIATICGEFLRRRWYDMKGNREKGAVLNSQVGELLQNYLAFSADQLTSVTDILSWLPSEHQQLADKDGTLTTFPSFSRLNLHVLIGGLLKGLESAVKQKLENSPSDREQLELWSSFTQGLETLVTVVKAHDSKPNLRVFMKGCTAVLKLFLAQGMSTCRFMFKHDPATVSQILKKLQVTTRYIQTICNYVKVSKDTGLNQYLPPIRAVLETILLQVRSIIVINNCTDAFFMGSMKNRDLKGQEIPSQETCIEEDGEPNSLQNGSESEPEKEDNESSAIDSDGEGNEDNEASNSISI